MKVIISLFLTILLTSLSSAIVINEFTVDPQTDWDNSGSATVSDEWIELYNPSNQTLNLTGWTIVMDDSLTTNASIEFLDKTLPPFSYTVILNPEGTMSMSGQIIIYNELDQLIDSVTYGTWDDGNPIDNAPDGGADSYADECIARIPNGQDTDIDSDDFIKTECTYNAENDIIAPNEQNLIVTIAGRIVFNVFPRLLDFGLVQPGSFDNPATNGPIIFDVTGSEQDVNVQITNVTGFPFEDGLKIDGSPALGASWFIPFTNPIVNATPTLDIPSDAQAGQAEGTIIYTVTGPTP
ncbi:MAG: lamin tail domain-containing protein [archaeon]